MITEAAVLVNPTQPLELMELDVPATAPGQVLVEILYAGICGSQNLEISGKRGPDAYLPHCLGHEGSGRVLEVGEGVTKVKAGDLVVLTWIKGRGADVPASLYGGPDGNVNAGAITTWQRHALISENRVVKVPDETPPREAALLGCCLPTGAGMVLNVAKVKAGESVAVFGCGGVGLAAIMTAAQVGADPIVAIDVRSKALALAEELGATHLVQGPGGTYDAVMGSVAGRRVDYAFETAGRSGLMSTAHHCVRENGGLAVIAGNLPAGEYFAVDPMDLIRGKRLVGTWGGNCDADNAIPVMARGIISGEIPASKLVGEVYGLSELPEALQRPSAAPGRALIDMGL